MTAEKQRKTKFVICTAYAYLLLPFLLFAAGWMKNIIWIPVVLLLLYCYVKACQDTPAMWWPELTRENLFKFLVICAVIAFWVYCSGIGRFVYQNDDHPYRNGIFELLVYADWPIKNSVAAGGTFPAGATITSLIYYIGFWLPSAAVGKVLGIEAGYYFQAVWAFAGILMVYYFICAHKKKLILWPLLVLILFGGLDVIGCYLRYPDFQTFYLFGHEHMEWWSEPYQYSNVTVQLFWVFNQAIPAWLATILTAVQKNNRNLVFILGCLLLSSTFPFVGLALLAAFWAFTRSYPLPEHGSIRQRGTVWLKLFIKDTFTIQNVIGGGITGILSAMYLLSNTASTMIMAESRYGSSYDNNIMKYGVFILLEFGIYFIFLYKYNKGKPLYYFLLIGLCLIPPIKVGTGGDFCMRASIPLLFLLLLMVIDTLETAVEKKHRRLLYGLVLALSLGSITAVHEFGRTFQITAERIAAGEPVYSYSVSQEDLLNNINFSGVVNDSFFFRYITK